MARHSPGIPPSGEEMYLIRINQQHQKNNEVLDPTDTVRSALDALFQDRRSGTRRFFPDGRVETVVRSQKSEEQLRDEVQERLPGTTVQVQKM